MTTSNDTKSRHYRSLEVLIQSQLAELGGSQPGIVVVQPQVKQLDAYTTFGAGLDLRDSESLEQLRWVKATEKHGVWSCVDVEQEVRDKFIKLVGRQAEQAHERLVGQ